MGDPERAKHEKRMRKRLRFPLNSLEFLNHLNGRRTIMLNQNFAMHCKVETTLNGPAPQQAPAAWPKRFVDKVDTSAGPDACWPWTASRTSRGYGKYSLVSRVGSDFTVWVRDNEACRLLQPWFCVMVTSRG